MTLTLAKLAKHANATLKRADPTLKMSVASDAAGAPECFLIETADGKLLWAGPNPPTDTEIKLITS